jgi:hypothetical protein
MFLPGWTRLPATCRLGGRRRGRPGGPRPGAPAPEHQDRRSAPDRLPADDQNRREGPTGRNGTEGTGWNNSLTVPPKASRHHQNTSAPVSSHGTRCLPRQDKTAIWQRHRTDGSARVAPMVARRMTRADSAGRMPLSKATLRHDHWSRPSREIRLIAARVDLRATLPEMLIWAFCACTAEASRGAAPKFCPGPCPRERRLE